MTVYVMLTTGPDLFTGLSLIVLALLTFGILGALTEPPTSAADAVHAPAGRTQAAAAPLAAGRAGGAARGGGDAAARGRAGEPPPRAGARRDAAPGPLQESGTAPLAGGGTAPSPLAVRLDDPRDSVRVQFRKPPRSGLLFDLDTGRVLWRHAPQRVLPIASLTKMMTALIVVDRVPERARVKITKEALAYTGSGVGMFKRGKRIDVEHDAARAAAAVRQRRRDRALACARPGSQARFVAPDEPAGARDGPGVHALLVGQRHQGPGQPLVRARPGGARAGGAARAAAGPDRAPALGRAAGSRSRAASSTSTTTTRCCGWATAARPA